MLETICTNEALLLGKIHSWPSAVFQVHTIPVLSPLYTDQLTLHILRQRHRTVVFPEPKNLPILPEGHLGDFSKTWSQISVLLCSSP